MAGIIYLGLFVPLLSFILLLFSSFHIGRKTVSWIGCGSILISFLCFLWCLYFESLPREFLLFQWIPVEGIWADFSLYIDPISMLMTLIITGVGFLIHVYSVGYMEHDADFARFFACLNFFIFSMLLLVLAKNLLLLFVGWEGVGLASYLLIGFWYEREDAPVAAVKAFVVNRIGDLGFLLALIFTLHVFGTGNIIEITAKAKEIFASGSPIITMITLLFFLGAIGKSAQIPLHTWLPDAMAGPTPVSALIHAATMVTAGIYLIVRMHDLFLLSPLTMHVIGTTGALTGLYASLSALGQIDIKKVLAYSTISQLGLMFLACGAGSFYAAMFHLTTHAFIKALLFLSAGNILHAAHEVTDLNKMGDLSKKLPVTHWLFLIGVLALSGVPPLAAFFSKDFILEEEHILGWNILYYLGLAASILTGVYLIRAYYFAFLGSTRMEKTLFNQITESKMIMLIPIFVLGILTVIGGFLGYAVEGISPLESFLGAAGIRDIIHNSGNIFHTDTMVAIFGSLAGIFITWGYLSRSKEESTPYEILKKAFYFDEIYHAMIEIPIQQLSLFFNAFEGKVIEKMMFSTANFSLHTARALQYIQNGQIRSYVAWMTIGTGIALIYFVF